MVRTTFIIAIVSLLSSVAGGCTHLAPVTATTDARGNAVYASTLRYADGTPRTTVVETVMGSDSSCDVLRIERNFYDRTGMLVERTTDSERCMVVEARVTETFDLDAGRSYFVALRDLDRDGRFDKEVRSSRGLSQSQLAALSE